MKNLGKGRQPSLTEIFCVNDGNNKMNMLNELLKKL